MSDQEKRIRDLEESVRESLMRDPITRRRFQRGEGPDIASKLDIAEKNVERILASGVLDEKNAAKFRELADAALKDQAREIIRGGAGEISPSINCTVTGTATISTGGD